MLLYIFTYSFCLVSYVSLSTLLLTIETNDRVESMSSLRHNFHVCEGESDATTYYRCLWTRLSLVVKVHDSTYNNWTVLEWVHRKRQFILTAKANENAYSILIQLTDRYDTVRSWTLKILLGTSIFVSDKTRVNFTSPHVVTRWAPMQEAAMAKSKNVAKNFILKKIVESKHKRHGQRFEHKQQTWLQSDHTGCFHFCGVFIAEPLNVIS